MSNAASPSLEEIEALLFLEADLLDEHKLEEWLALYTDDATYYIPGDDPEGDPRTHASILSDDRPLMEDRVWRLRSGAAHAQIPPSQTCRIVANVRLAEVDPRGEIVVHSRLLITEARRGERRTVAGRVEHRLRRVDGALRITHKSIRLVDANMPQYNLTFIL
jgi:3-phenylpropionate/cinnamic acid dioxygenase small subunit